MNIMTQILQLSRQIGAWWHAAKFVLAILIVALLISQGLHPVWGILLFIYRRAALRVCLFLGLLYWLTQGIL
jgi:1,4-dihydroxy-2-naphthoate octaprenyltransferase